MNDLTTLIIACLAAFLAGFIDAIAGGGGLIQLPTLLLLGLPPSLALGTNKMVSFCGTAIATLRYSLSVIMPWKLILSSLPIALLGAYFGAHLILITDSELARKIIVILLPMIFILMIVFGKKKKPCADDKPKSASFLTTTGVCGLYDGYLGPGVGTFLATSFNRWSKMNYILATACAKPINLTTNLGALLAFVAAGQIQFELALPMAGFSILGSFLGSSGALHFGESFVKNMLIVSFMLLAGINLWKVFF